MQKKSEKFTKSNRPMSSCGPTKLGPIRYYPNLYILPPDEPRVLLLTFLSTRLARAPPPTSQQPPGPATRERFVPPDQSRSTGPFVCRCWP